jgi:hypothetical protein
MNLFDAAESERRKDAGMALAAASREAILEVARERARFVAREHGEVSMDDVAAALVVSGYDPADLGNAAGSVFRGSEWVWTGRFVRSSRVASHSNLLRVWRLA